VTELPDPGNDELADRDVVGLMVVNPTGIHFRPLAEGGAAYDPEKAPYTWHWPERA
jgi:hypothetical protein